MAPPNWNVDRELLRDLAELLRRDPVEPDPVERRVIDAAASVRRWRASDPECELAELVFDSDLDGGPLVRGACAGSCSAPDAPRFTPDALRFTPDTPRTLVFGRGGCRVELEVGDEGIEGQLVPAGPGTVRMRTVDGSSTETTADRVGCFSFPSPRRVPVRIEWAVTGHRFVTGWIAA